MLSFLSSWTQGIIVSVVIASIIEMILPNGNTKKYIKVIIGIYILFNIINPIINKFMITSKSNLDLSKFIDLDTYIKNENNTNKNSIESKNEENIKHIYISKLKTDIKNKLSDMNYEVYNISINLENDSNYTIKNISIELLKKVKGKEENKEKNINEDEIKEIEEIEEVNIVILENENDFKINKKGDESDVTEKEKDNIKEFLNRTYNIKIQNIYIS